MIKRSLHFWVLLVCALFIGALLFSLALKIMKIIFFLGILVAVIPVIFVFLKHLLSAGSTFSRTHKLKSRN